MTLRFDQAVELLRGALHLLRASDMSAKLEDLLYMEQPANGGGDGYCLMEEIQNFFDEIGVDYEKLGTPEALTHLEQEEV